MSTGKEILDYRSPPPRGRWRGRLSKGYFQCTALCLVSLIVSGFWWIGFLSGYVFGLTPLAILTVGGICGFSQLLLGLVPSIYSWKAGIGGAPGLFLGLLTLAPPILSAVAIVLLFFTQLDYCC